MAASGSLRDRLQAVDVVHVIGLGAAAAGVVASWEAVAFGPWIVAANLVLIAAVICLAFGPLDRAAPSRAAIWRMTISYALVALLFVEMAALVPAINPIRYDTQLLGLDLTVFALHPATSFNGMHHPALGELFAVTYVSFYAIPLTFFVLLYRKGALDRIGTGNLAVVVAFYVSFLGNALVPAASPLRTIEPEVPLTGLFFFDTVYSGIDRFETHQLSAFPSGHILVAAVVILLSAKWHPRALPLFLVWTGLLSVGTIYLRYHYLVDTLAAVALAPPCIAIALALSRWLARSRPRTTFASD